MLRLEVQENEHKDMFFVMEVNLKDDDKILKVFYNMRKALDYIEEYKKVNHLKFIKG